MKVIIYTRTSSEDLEALKGQYAVIKSFASMNEFEIIGEYFDNGVPGLDLNRHGIQALISHCEKGNVDAVIVDSFDRISRSVEGLLEFISKLQKLNIKLLTTT